jgi:hypothetical protein
MSRRRDRGSGRRRPPAAEPHEASAAGRRGGASESGGEWMPGAPAPNRQPPRLSFVAQVGVLVAVFAVVSLIADLAGAANLGVALGIGVIAFAIALVAVIVKN